MKPLQGNVALITGGSTETAQAVAVSLADLEADICITGQQTELLEGTATAIPSSRRYSQTVSWRCEIRDASSLLRMLPSRMVSVR